MLKNHISSMADPMVLFYADDDPDDIVYFRDALSEVNSSAILFSHRHGQTLLHSLENPPPTPHIVFLDLNMPVKNGFQVLEEVNKSDNLKNTPIVVFSTSDDTRVIEKCRDLGATMYITKPTSYPALKQSISFVLNSNWQEFAAEKRSFAYTFGSMMNQ